MSSTMRKAKPKTKLDPRDKIKAAYLYHCRGMDQQLIAEVLDCSNIGRINEAIKAIEKAVYAK